MYAIDFNYPFEFETTVIKHLTTTSKKKENIVCVACEQKSKTKKGFN